MAATDAKALVIEDDDQMRRVLTTALRAHDYLVIEATTARLGLAHATAHNPAVILLDLGLPDGDGLDLVRALRQRDRIPIIVISARGMERDKVSALDLGADDYLTKPFSVNELLARIRVARRHASPKSSLPDDAIFTAKGVKVDFAARRVFRDAAEVHLTPTEYHLLGALIRHAGQVLTHRQLLVEVWGEAYQDQTHYLRVYMAQLRHKLEADPARPRLLTTEPGAGYRLVEDGSE